MPSLPRGLYEVLLTDLLQEALRRETSDGLPQVDELRNAEAADRIALHLASVVTRAIEGLREEDRARTGAAIARKLIALVTEATDSKELLPEQPVEPPKLLRSISPRLPDGTPGSIAAPLIPLLDTTLLTNAPGEPRVLHQLQAEIESADRIDLVMAFIRLSGIRPLCDMLRRHVEAGRPLRVLTSTYTQTTELAALELLEKIGATIRVSYETGSTRLHAKAWLFHRASGFSTAYVGSSNLTHSAQVTGLEWNVRLSAARNRHVIDKVAAVFTSYWENADFAPFDRAQFLCATQADQSGESTYALSPLEVRLHPFQERLLEQIAVARAQDRHRNLLVSATGTGKTVMAAVDYARLRGSLPRTRLLFVAHRAEILERSRHTFAQVLRDSAFGELWVGGARPRQFEHVFASIQSLDASGLESLASDHFDVVIVDEFHHAAASSYRRLLEHLRPRELLGLTATPERTDGESVLTWFGGRIAAELRLWDAIDQHCLAPFAYYGVADDLDLREIPWRRGVGYDPNAISGLITATDVWAHRVLHQLSERVGRLEEIRALGFCVSVAHARYMERVFRAAGVRATAVWGESPEYERTSVLSDLSNRRVNVVFSVDLYNEGVDVPAVDVVLLLRPSDSGLLFLQQLGRGLRPCAGKTVCTVLDFVGQHHRQFRFDRRLSALLGGTRRTLISQLEQGFPFLPAGCHFELDRVARERVLDNLKNAVPSRFREKAEDLRRLAAANPAITLGEFLAEAGYTLEDVYSSDRGWSALKHEAGLRLLPAGPKEQVLWRGCGRLLHIDEGDRLDTWSAWLRADTPPDFTALPIREQRLMLMLLVQLCDGLVERETSAAEAAKLVWAHPQVRAELGELFEVLAARIEHVGPTLDAQPNIPLRIHARYTRQEILSAAGVNQQPHEVSWREGVRFARESNADLLVFTLDKTDGQFSPTTRYRDYAISRELVHWESQSGARAQSPTGQRYQRHVDRGSHIYLFGRVQTSMRAFHFLGPATYVSHEGEAPMAITWRLHHPLPGDLFQSYAAAVA